MSWKNYTMDGWDGDGADSLTEALAAAGQAVEDSLHAGILNAAPGADGTVGLQIELGNGYELVINLKPVGTAEWSLYKKRKE